MRSVAIVSGGMDSVTLAYLLAASGDDLHLVSVDYGQRHRRELDCAALAARRLGARHDVVDLRGLGVLARGSALTSGDTPVPEGHYAEDTMRATVVPNRNAVLLALGFAAAVADGADRVATAVHAGDHAVYPDCRPEFLAAFGYMQTLATEGFGNPGLHAPFAGLTKADIVSVGAEVGTPWRDTWSCYVGGAIHCGRCSTDVERQEAFHLAGVGDPTDYADPNYWRQAVAEFQGAR